MKDLAFGPDGSFLRILQVENSIKTLYKPGVYLSRTPHPPNVDPTLILNKFYYQTYTPKIISKNYAKTTIDLRWNRYQNISVKGGRSLYWKKPRVWGKKYGKIINWILKFCLSGFKPKPIWTVFQTLSKNVFIHFWAKKSFYTFLMNKKSLKDLPIQTSFLELNRDFCTFKPLSKPLLYF